MREKKNRGDVVWEEAKALFLLIPRNFVTFPPSTPKADCAVIDFDTFPFFLLPLLLEGKENGRAWRLTTIRGQD